MTVLENFQQAGAATKDELFTTILRRGFCPVGM